MDIRSYIEDLFRYFGTFETRYTEFDTEAFLQTYGGLYTMFKALSRQRDEAVNVDRVFLDKIKKTPLTSSDFRQVVIQILITFFESEADIDGQSNKAYLHCRDLRPVKQDIPFFETHLLPMLFKGGSLNNNFQLNAFLLQEIARYYNKFGRSIRDDITPEDFAAKSDPYKFLELLRRRMILGTDLADDRSSLEFHLLRVDAFRKLSVKNRLHRQYLTQWNYLRKTSFWAKLKSSLVDVWSRIKGTFKSFRYFRLVMTQRAGAYIFYGAIILIFIFLAVYVPLKWADYSNNKLDEFRQKATTVQGGAGR